MNNNNELARKMESVLIENVMLRQENTELRKKLNMQKNWTNIREGYLIPMLRKKYGYGACLYSNITTHIGSIVKEYLGISRLTEITEVNYDLAKSISISLIETLCKYEWEHLRKMQDMWGKSY